jgi:hypothetical protein
LGFLFSSPALVAFFLISTMSYQGSFLERLTFRSWSLLVLFLALLSHWIADTLGLGV